MLDFLMISKRPAMRGKVIEIYPKFIVKKSSDLMIRGGDFYAVWDEDTGMWSTDEQDVIRMIDHQLDIYAEKHKGEFDDGIGVKVLHMWDSESGMIDKWHRYCQKHMRDSFHMLDDKLIFSNTKTKKEDYASHKLTYPLEFGDITAYDKLISKLYSEEERKKIEWAIGAVVSGESKKIQKFLVFYGDPGSGKSTILKIIEKLFDGYFAAFDAKSLGSSNNSFALEAFRNNPLVGIQHEGDLSRIEDNTRLNSLVSHETMIVNEKFKSAYENSFRCFLFMATNKPVKITDAKSGLIRRLIDVSPTGEKFSLGEYNELSREINFELGAIAYHCLKVYEENKNAYDNYIPITMLGASNDFYNFVEDSYLVFNKEGTISLSTAWEMYKAYCNEARVLYPLSQRVFKEELKNYFYEYKERGYRDDGTRVRSVYIGFRKDRFQSEMEHADKEDKPTYILSLGEGASILDEECSECSAQYATEAGTPKNKWEKVKTKLKDIDTSKLHYVKLPENHIVIDFDIPDENGNKSLERNIEAASKWPRTYAEVSKSGSGIHLHYIYTGDVKKLSAIYDEHIEVKTSIGNSSLRRKLTLCTIGVAIATISSGLPLKGEKMVNLERVKDEKHLRNMILKALRYGVHANTKPNVDFIVKILNDAYSNGIMYDVSDMRPAIFAFAASSTHQADACMKLVNQMKFKSEDFMDPPSVPIHEIEDEKPIAFFDIEVFPNLLLVCWKTRGSDNVVRMYNPSSDEVAELITRYRLIGFNCRRYDNHILYGRIIGLSNEELYKLSSKIINGNRDCFYGDAYNISYTDIYDFASAGNKKSLKKLEIEMGIHHQELGIPFDQPVDASLWDQVGEYCDNDVIATEAAFDYLKADWTARQILADLAGMTVNDTTNSLTTRIIFGNDRKPQNQFCYRDLSKPFDYDEFVDAEMVDFLKEACPEMMAQPFKAYDGGESLLPYFPGYKFDRGVSTYRGEEVGEGGYVYSEPGMYGNVALLDIVSMHPHSAIAECLFGPDFTRAFRDIVEGRVSIKHESWNEVNHMLNGKLTPYIQKVIDGEMKSKDLANALKTAINSVYGLTSASFENPFKDIRNIDNIVAKRGALFMVDLKHEVQKRGFIVAHIKTDSIKIPDATPEIINFVMDFGKRYGYTFEHEATYDRMCLVNDAVYIAKDAKDGHWTATGTQFQVPYVFKTLFSKEEIVFDDLCETKSVTTTLYLDMNEDLPDVSGNEKELEKLERDYKKGIISDTTFETLSPPVIADIEKGHNYVFIGRVGRFCPIKPGCGGGLLMRYNPNTSKYAAAPGTKGYRWLESEKVRVLNKEDDIDISYYRRLVDEAVATICKFGDFEWFVSDDPYIPPVFHEGRPIYDDNTIF